MLHSLKEIARALGGKVSGRQVLAPGPGHGPGDYSMAVKPMSSDFLVHSFAGQDWRECRDHVRKRLGLPDCESKRSQLTPRAKALQPQEDIEHRVECALKIWRQTTPLTADCLGWRYFTERRGLYIGPLRDLSHAVRWHGGIGAVVALMTDPATNTATGIHRTFLSPTPLSASAKCWARLVSSAFHRMKK